jgi:cell division protein FtsX
MSVIFSLLSATLHQLWFFYNNVSDIFINNLFVMIIGNLSVTIIVLLLIKTAVGLLKQPKSPIK